MRDFKKILKRTDAGLIQFFLYVGALIYLLLKGYGWWSVVFVHLFFVFVYGVIDFRYEFLIFFLAPITAILFPIQNYRLKKYLRNFKQNIPAKAVIVLGQSDWFKLNAWIRHNFLKSEIESLVQYLKTKGQDFSFYPNASLKDIEKIMSDKSIKEVYFFGHGTSHVFQLNTDDFLYYCDFNDPQKYGKEFVHQVHCGTPNGKSLIDYVVPKENRDKCFFFRKSINSFDIQKEFKRRTKNIQGGI